MKLQDLKFHSGAYLAFELSSESRAKLLKLFPPKFSKVICNHVTLEFRLTAEKLASIQKSLGATPAVRVTGYAEDDGVECFTIEINDSAKRFDGQIYHVTHSVEPPHKPVESNKLLAKLNGQPQKALASIKLDGAFRLIKL